jgi:hypothetical protein
MCSEMSSTAGQRLTSVMTTPPFSLSQSTEKTEVRYGIYALGSRFVMVHVTFTIEVTMYISYSTEYLATSLHKIT